MAKFASQYPAVYDERLLELLLDPQSLNSYAYCRNNPVGLVDPTGEYNVETGEIEEGDTAEGITNAVSKVLGITTTWGDIAQVSFFLETYGTIDPTELVGKFTFVGSYTTIDITNILDNLNISRAQEAIDNGYGKYTLAWKFREGGIWDIKNNGGILGGGKNGRVFYAYIYHDKLIRYDAPGNINFGYVSRAVGIPLNNVLTGGDFEQISGNDNPYDKTMIRNGYFKYSSYTKYSPYYCPAK